MNGKKRYKKRGYKACFFRWLRRLGLIAVLIHFAVFCIIAYYKGNMIMYNDRCDIFLVSNYLSALPVNADSEEISECLSRYYPSGFDSGRKGVEKAALIVSAETHEIIAVNDKYTDNEKTLGKLKNEYTELISGNNYNYTMPISFPFIRANEVRYDLMTAGKRCILITYMELDYHVYFMKYFLMTDVFLIVSVTGISLYIASAEKFRDMQDEYRKSIINSLSHDLKTPLTVISGCAENLKENIEPDKREYYEDAIIENASYTKKLIDNALEFVKTEDCVKIPESEQCDVSDMINDIWKKYDYPASEKCLLFQINGDRILKGDRAMLEQMFENIISNSVKYSDQNGTVIVSLERKKISVSNDFSGKTDIDINKLKEPFVRGNKERSGNGSGLGLAIADNIAKIHGAKLSVDVKNGRFTVDIKI